MTKVALVSFKYPSVYSGYGKQLQLVTEEIVKSTEDITFTVLTGYSESLNNKKSKIDIKALLETEDDHNSKSIFPFSKEVFKWLIKNKNTYDVIHCVKAGPEAMVCNLASKLLGKPLVVKVAQDELSDREISSVGGVKKISRLIRHKLLASVSNYIAISEEIKDNILKRTSKKTVIHRIPNGVNTDKFTPIEITEKIKLREKLHIQSDDVVMLYTGAINKRKGIIDLFDGLEIYDNKVPLKVVMCGPVLEEINFEKRVKELNKKSNLTIDYRGKVSNVDEYMKAADFFILPSYSEGLPNVLLEAASTGLPLIATDIGGSRDIVDAEFNGYLVNTNSPLEIKQKITLLSSNKDKRNKFGRESRNKVLNSFSIKQVQSRYIKLYNDLV